MFHPGVPYAVHTVHCEDVRKTTFMFGRQTSRTALGRCVHHAYGEVSFVKEGTVRMNHDLS
jgi:hypothetical protein